MARSRLQALSRGRWASAPFTGLDILITAVAG
jgi:hypothetical protein